MKKAIRVLSLIMALSMLCLVLASCGDKSAAIKKAFENKDWEVSVVDSETSGVDTLLNILLTEEQKEHVDEYELILVKKGLLQSALIIKFASANELKTFLTIEKDGEKDTSMYDKAEENGTINGNCMIITLSGDAKEIFAGA